MGVRRCKNKAGAWQFANMNSVVPEPPRHVGAPKKTFRELRKTGRSQVAPQGMAFGEPTKAITDKNVRAVLPADASCLLLDPQVCV